MWHQEHHTAWILLCTCLHTYNMPGNRIVVFALVAALLLSSAAGEAKESKVLQQLLARGEKARDSASRQVPQTRSAPMERRAHLSGDEREIMTKQIMQAISEMMNSGCMSDRDYQGWVDFGRRDAE
ncbi:gastrin/cholecystokinin-like peptide isoform X1 [Thunnus albacares]|uniref:gastrin/cholecystokinin-like peptide n=1 Tax=Thunnus thynnus TaxID=8237 RepID=UPI001CF6CAD7|nr:gastrin/cholecystokinin-like peptide isoform X1 [Thunnus albacares]